MLIDLGIIIEDICCPREPYNSIFVSDTNKVLAAGEHLTLSCFQVREHGGPGLLVLLEQAEEVLARHDQCFAFVVDALDGGGVAAVQDDV